MIRTNAKKTKTTSDKIEHFMKFHENSWDFMGLHGSSCDIMRSHEMFRILLCFSVLKTIYTCLLRKNSIFFVFPSWALQARVFVLAFFGLSGPEFSNPTVLGCPAQNLEKLLGPFQPSVRIEILLKELGFSSPVKIWHGFQIPWGFPTKTYAKNWFDIFSNFDFDKCQGSTLCKTTF